MILRCTDNYASQLVEHRAREEGASNYTRVNLIRLWLNMFTSFSILPLRVATLAGFVFSVTGFLLAIAFTIERLIYPDIPRGWATTVVLLMIVSGVQLFALGMIGEYLGRLFLKDNGSPMFVARETVNCDDEQRGDSHSENP